MTGARAKFLDLVKNPSSQPETVTTAMNEYLAMLIGLLKDQPTPLAPAPATTAAPAPTTSNDPAAPAATPATPAAPAPAAGADPAAPPPSTLRVLQRVCRIASYHFRAHSMQTHQGVSAMRCCSSGPTTQATSSRA